MADARETILGEFMNMMAQFLTALKEVFPEDVAISGYKALFDFKTSKDRGESARKVVCEEGITDWHRNMSIWYEACRKHDERVFYADIPMMASLKIAEKLTPDLHPETKEAVWEYLERLNDFANMYAMYGSVPSGMMGNIQTMAAELAAKIQNGEMSFGDLNLVKLGEQVAAAVDPDELQEFSSSLASTPGGSMGAIGNMYSAMNTMMRK